MHGECGFPKQKTLGFIVKHNNLSAAKQLNQVENANAIRMTI